MSEIEALLERLDGDLEQIAPVTPIVPVVQSEVELAIDVREHVKRHEAISNEILGSWRSDRAEAQNAITLLRNLIDETVLKGSHPSGTVLEVYVNAIKTKNDSSQVAVRLLDATSKLLTATKAAVNLNNTTNNLIVGELEQILQDDIRPEDV